MKKNGVLLTVLVSDYDLALRFYLQLGLFDLVAETPLSDSERYVCISLKEYVDKFMIHLKVPRTPEGVLMIGKQCEEVLITLPVKDVESLHADLRSKGMQIEEEIEWRPYGGGFLVADPFGNTLSLFEFFLGRFDEVS